MNMEKEEKKQDKKLIKWVKAHKKQLIMAGISIPVIIGLIVTAKNTDAVSKLIDQLKTLFTEDVVSNAINVEEGGTVSPIYEILKETGSKAPHMVSEHIRNLPNGYHASDAKISEALRKGIELMEGQTLVDTYRTGNLAA